MALKGLFDIVENFLLKMGDSNKEDETKKVQLYTEEDILKAMEDLPEPPPPVRGYLPGELNCKVPSLGLWSSFEYLGESPSGVTDGKDKFFYVIPTGWEYESELKMWYMGFHFDDNINDLFEFHTTYDYSGEKETSDI